MGAQGKTAKPTVVNGINVDVVLPNDAPKDDLWRLQLSVDCKIAGPSYFTRDGIIIFTKKDHDAWQPASFFARRIAKYLPGRTNKERLMRSAKRSMECGSVGGAIRRPFLHQPSPLSQNIPIGPILNRLTSAGSQACR